MDFGFKVRGSNYCAVGDFFAIVFKEADPPLANTNVERVVLNKFHPICRPHRLSLVKHVNDLNRVEMPL
jgi:hypothetical protein